MSAPSGLVIDIVDLPHAVGATKDVRLRVPAPPGLSTAVIGTPEGSPVAVDATLTVLEDGVLVRATADLHVHGECVRCLQDLDEDRTVRLEELYHLPREAAQCYSFTLIYLKRNIIQYFFRAIRKRNIFKFKSTFQACFSAVSKIIII